MKITPSIKKELPLIAAVASLLLTAAALSASIIYALDGAGLEDRVRSEKIYADTSDLRCEDLPVPDSVFYDKSSVYTTPYGTFEPIGHILEINEYMTLSPIMNDSEVCRQYITEDGDEKQARMIMAQIKALSDDICRGIDNDFDKAYALAMWTGTNTAYDFDAAADEGSSLSVTSLEAIIENDFKTTCGGFANLFSALCHSQGIYCLNMKGGTASDGWTRAELENAPANHEWNAVAIDGKWYFTDCTWISDLSFENGTLSGGDDIKPFYAMFGFGEMSVEHRIDRCEHRCYGYDGAVLSEE